MNITQIVGRTRPLFSAVVSALERDPRGMHVVDLSENSLVELVRDVRSTQSYGSRKA